MENLAEAKMCRIAKYIIASFSAGFLFSIDFPALAASYNSLYSFDYPVKLPTSDLRDVNGILYGTTLREGQGFIFSFDPATNETKILHKMMSDGGSPRGRLLNVKGTLYGTAASDFSCHKKNCGAVFSINPTTGVFSLIHKFRGPDGAGPYGSLINVRDTVYGTTKEGGLYGYGTVFSINLKSHKETVLHSFQSDDGAYPIAGVLQVDKELYGTTLYGGESTNCDGGCGTVFKINPSTGDTTVLHSFNKIDGYAPEADLINVNGTLYGTTVEGGKKGCGAYGCGIVFSLNLATGSERALFAFRGYNGQWPNAGLLSFDGALYGTTEFGGVNGVGAAFKLMLDGKEGILHSFGDGKTDGRFPQSGLISAKKQLYGTTFNGGTSDIGTIYSIGQ